VDQSSKLSEKRCSPCQGELPLLSKAEIQNLVSQLHNWHVEEEKFLVRQYKTKNFASALALANKVGMVAEEQGHHPDLFIAWGMLSIKIWTHAANGLSENDFILAAKIDKVMESK
jgi:4a-hydroxytetrahydrobiopterin dehydratase